MLLAEVWLPDHDDLITIRNLPSVLGQITSLTERTASEDLGYTILHRVNSLANDLIGPTIPCQASAPAPGLAILTLPPWIEFPASHVQDEPLDVPHPESYDALLEPLVHPWASIEMSTCRPLLGPRAPIIMPPICMLRMAPITSPDSLELTSLDAYVLRPPNAF